MAAGRLLPGAWRGEKAVMVGDGWLPAAATARTAVLAMDVDVQAMTSILALPN